ncbi:MAG: UbiA family prenyltransferase [Candidatus Aenigmarchaeota archaeon]|nr:UbiA family prenyltransferase [Candidatus Aenigmarchaeota archaeon]
MKGREFLYILYKRVRPGFGVPFAFIIMYGMFTNAFSPLLLLAAAGFLLLEIYGGLYNDYWDYEDDIRNGRKDKFTTTGILSRRQARDVSLAIAAFSLVLLSFTNIIVFALGAYYAILFIFYSHPAVRLKGSVKGYATLSSMFLLLPFGLDMLMGVGPSMSTLLFGSFFFFQCTYILCQKDSTDMKDTINLFIRHGWARSTRITALFGALSSFSLLSLSLFNIYFAFVWLFNLLAKLSNINSIRARTISRTKRYRLVLAEFLTPYMYAWGGLIVL